MAYRAKRIMRRSSLYPAGKSSTVGGTSRVSFIESTQSLPFRKRQSLPSLSSDFTDSTGYILFLIKTRKRLLIYK